MVGADVNHSVILIYFGKKNSVEIFATRPILNFLRQFVKDGVSWF